MTQYSAGAHYSRCGYQLLWRRRTRARVNLAENPVDDARCYATPESRELNSRPWSYV